jgi:phosphoglucosamine mutase
VTVTPMTNGGFHELMAQHGIETYVTEEVGDRYVLELIRATGGKLGGEQSGHIIYLEGHVTGDGLVAALLLCRALEGRTLAEAAGLMPHHPQVKENVRVRSKTLSPELLEEVVRRNAELEGRGRVLVRPSGTEPVVRILAEARDEEEAEALCATIADLVRRELG